MERKTSNILTILGNVLVALGVAVWGVYALARWGFEQDVAVRQFLPFHLFGVIPGALLRHREKVKRLFKKSVLRIGED